MRQSIEERTRRLLRRQQLARLGVAHADVIVDTVSLADLRIHRGLTQDAVAAALGTRQADISKLESRGDMLLSSLTSYVTALGGELDLIARFPDGSRRVTLLGAPNQDSTIGTL